MGEENLRLGLEVLIGAEIEGGSSWNQDLGQCKTLRLGGGKITRPPAPCLETHSPSFGVAASGNGFPSCACGQGMEPLSCLSFLLRIHCGTSGEETVMTTCLQTGKLRPSHHGMSLHFQEVNRLELGKSGVQEEQCPTNPACGHWAIELK